MSSLLRGLTQPLTRTSRGDFASATGSAVVAANVGQVLATERGEVRWRPSFGRRLASLRHRANTLAGAELARIALAEALAEWEPRARVLDIRLEPDAGPLGNRLQLSVVYEVDGERIRQEALL